jgi:hypothetical protein
MRALAASEPALRTCTTRPTELAWSAELVVTAKALMLAEPLTPTEASVLAETLTPTEASVLAEVATIMAVVPHTFETAPV